MGPLGHSAAALAALAALPFGVALLVGRPALRAGWRERLGARAPTPPGAFWVHGASLGEVQAALRVVDALRRKGEPVVASATTLTGRALLRQRRPDLPSAFAPLDHPWCVATALRRTRPAVLVLVETELWPAWILGASGRGIPVAVVSARISDRSFPRYWRVRALLRPVLARLAAVGARSQADAERFAALGAPPERIEVTGDLKLEPPAEPPVLAADLERRLCGVPLWVAGSTHPGEECAALDALAALEAAGLAAALVLAPRHPERFEAVAAEVRARGRTLQRRSQSGAAPLAPGEVLLLDSVGELPAIYARASVAFVGGSLVSRGGHNLVEPAHAGRAVLFGPHTESSRVAAECLLAGGGARRVADATELASAVVEALRDPAAWAAQGALAVRAVAGHRGATERTLALLWRVRAAGPS